MLKARCWSIESLRRQQEIDFFSAQYKFMFFGKERQQRLLYSDMKFILTYYIG